VVDVSKILISLLITGSAVKPAAIAAGSPWPRPARLRRPRPHARRAGV